MRSIFQLFAKSPLGPMEEHMTKVKECVDKVPVMFEALCNDDHVRVKEIAKEIWALEHEADIIKTKIRDNIPRNIFLPMDRKDFLSMLSAQDEIADIAEDLGYILTMRRTKVPEAIKAELNILLESVIKVVELALKIVAELGNLEASAFGGQEAIDVLKMVDDLGVAEWESDKFQYKLSKKLFEIEEQESPVAIFIWTRIIITLGKIANHSEKLGKMIRGTLVC
ncbi:TIGR00153 family protein [bacterium]|nr:TIGR00153 family protein [bacterium]MBU1025506.1 TIGR00153 family protein [bacterium]